MNHLIIEKKDAFGSNVRIKLNDKSFKITQSIFNFNKKVININYNRFVHESGAYIYLHNQTQRVSIVFTEDLEFDFIRFSEDNGISINFNSNDHCGELFEQIEKIITTTING